jgi:hypothetical protein
VFHMRIEFDMVPVMKQRICIVTGAPGAGKSVALEAFLMLHTDYLAFDIDWLAEPASELAGRSIYFESSTWRAYSHVWFAVLDAAYRNSKIPVLFAPLDKNDIAKHGLPEWRDGVEWLLLECQDKHSQAALA